MMAYHSSLFVEVVAEMMCVAVSSSVVAKGRKGRGGQFDGPKSASPLSNKVVADRR